MTTPDLAPDPAVRAYVTERRAEFVAELSDWLRIPSISADPEHAGEVSRSADWLAQRCCAPASPSVEIWPTEGLPAVFAEWPQRRPGRSDRRASTATTTCSPSTRSSCGRPRRSSPSCARRRTARSCVGRGAIDDKGQVLFHLLGLGAHLAATGRTSPAVNLKLLVEGEEESGSVHFAELLRTHRDRLDCDVVVVSDTGMFGRDAIRSASACAAWSRCSSTLLGPKVDLHSGSFGGAVPNPLHGARAPRRAPARRERARDAARLLRQGHRR